MSAYGAQTPVWLLLRKERRAFRCKKKQGLLDSKLIKKSEFNS